MNCDNAIFIFNICFNGKDKSKATCGIGTLHTKNAQMKNDVLHPYVIPFFIEKNTNNIKNI